GYIDIREPITVGETEFFFIPDVGGNTLETPSRECVFARVNERYLPWFGIALVDLHSVVRNVKGDIRHVKEVICEVFLDDISLVAAADDKLIHAMCRIELHDVPEYRLTSDLHHRLGFEIGFLGDTGTKAPCQDHRFHSRCCMLRRYPRHNAKSLN